MVCREKEIGIKYSFILERERVLRNVEEYENDKNRPK